MAFRCETGLIGKAPFVARESRGPDAFSISSGLDAVKLCIATNLDLFVATTSRNLLYHNNGNASFSRILSGSIATDAADSLGCTWGDYDHDGFLDLVVTTFDPNASSHCFLYRNNGDGTFSSVIDSVLTTDIGSSIGCAWGDYDNDGLLDLFVPNSFGLKNLLYHNNGDGTFNAITITWS